MSFFFVFFFALFETLVLTISLCFGNLVSRSCSTYLDKETTFSLLKISFSSSVSHETMADCLMGQLALYIYIFISKEYH